MDDTQPVQCANAQRAGQCICVCTPGRIPVAVQDSSPPLVATAHACAQPCAWPAATAATAAGNGSSSNA
eukprot:364270-Chlamydomonas_euryale.AAC.8